MHSISALRFLSMIALVLLLAACGGGVGGDTTIAPTTPNFRIVDLTSGAYTTQSAQPDLTQAQYSTTAMAFRRVPGSATVGEFWLAMLELTQGQWAAITGDPANTPWKLVTQPGTVGSAVTVANKPAYGLTADEVIATLGTWSTAHANTLLLPSETQWEWACRAGTTGLFAWGDSLDPAFARSFAVARETASGSVGVQVVGDARISNGLTLWDMHGNVREWVTTSGVPVLRGGSWADNLLQCRSASRFIGVDRDRRHALSGARLMFTAP